MKNRLLFFLCLSFLGFGVVQAQDCKPAYESTDIYTNKKYVMYGGILYQSPLMSDKLYTTMLFFTGTEDDTLHAWVYLQYIFNDIADYDKRGKMTDLNITKGNNLYLIVDGKPLKFTAIEDGKKQVKDKHLASKTITETFYSKFSVTPEQITQLGTAPITSFRLERPDGSTLGNDKEKAKPKYTEKIKEQMKCAQVLIK